MSAQSLMIDGLSRFEALELVECMEGSDARLVEPAEDLTAAEYGDIVAVAVVFAATAVAISGMVTWLASQGKNVKFRARIGAPGSMDIEFSVTPSTTEEDVSCKLKESKVH